MIEQYWPLLAKSSGTRSLINYEIIYGYRKTKSLQDLIVRTDLKSLDLNNKKDPPKCNRKNCRHCPMIDKTGKIKNLSNGTEYKTLRKVTCNSTNLIYCITCNICNKQYVGQTKNKLLIRVNQHYSTIRTKKDTPVAMHFNAHNIFDIPPCTIYVLQLIRSNDIEQSNLDRNKWESVWMSRLNSYIPNGLNIME
jgi:hypothetical protein